MLSKSSKLRRSALAVPCGGAGAYLLCRDAVFDNGAADRVSASDGNGGSQAFLSPAAANLRKLKRSSLGAGDPVERLTAAAASPSDVPVPAAAALASAGLALCGGVGGAVLALSKRRSARQRPDASRGKIQRKFFGGEALEKLNPFYESPIEKTRKKYTPQVEAVAALEPSMKAKSDAELRDLTKNLQERAQSGEELNSLLPEAFAVVREASDRVLGLRPFDVQLIGGIALHEGNISEMGTGEGKTLVAILPAFLNALSGKGVHVVTVNDYLARRDAEWVGQPLRFLGLQVGVVQSGMTPEQKMKAYRCDVTYVTNSELGFDYLRDQMAGSPSDLCLREATPFNFAIVDEVDSILIDEARTPLIISGNAQNAPKKYEVACEVAKTLRKTVHYEVNEKEKQCLLIEAGVEVAEKLLGKETLFDPEDPWFPFIVNALNAKEVYVKDQAYLVKRGEVMIVDEFTGRVMDGRRWSNGLHQAVEAKEGVTIQAESVTLASISYQSLFRLFDKLGGMTGTAFTEAKEFKEIYKLETVVIPPNRERLRKDLDDQVYADEIAKWKAVAREIENAHRIGRPVLIGTTNVENSEILAELLDALGVPYQLLNAKPENVARETEIVASSGRKYSVTIATNMAGRGTDILLGGNSSMMARLKLREELFSRLFPRRSWTMPEEFYPIDMPESIRNKVRDTVNKTVEVWSQKTTEKPATTEAAMRIVEGDLTELEAEERLSLACEKAPTDDEVILALRDAYNELARTYKQVTDMEKGEVVALGGLLVLGTERHESRRIDNQLRGRCARQGDRGDTRFFLSLNDSIFRIFGGDNIKQMMSMMSFSRTDNVALESGMLSGSLEEAQKKVEGYFYSVRKNVFDYDDVMNTQRQIVYTLRRRALLDTDENIRTTMREFSDRNMEDFVDGHLLASSPKEKWLLQKLAENVVIYSKQLGDVVTHEILEEKAGQGGVEGEKAIKDYLKKVAGEAFEKKLEEIEENGPGLTAIVTRQVLLMQIDNFWQQHLKNMDFMKTGVTLRAYGQKNPLTEYKLEGYKVFLKMMSRIRRNAVYNVFLFQPRKLKPMTEERVKSLIPNREQRRKELEYLKSTPEYKERKAEEGDVPQSVTSNLKTVNLARLSINVKYVLDARESLGELALASFGELSDTFNRAGLLTFGDQLRWAQACEEFELLEDELNGEVYIGTKGRAEPQPSSGSAGASAAISPEVREKRALREMEMEELKEKQKEALTMMNDALANPEFMSFLQNMSDSPNKFLEELKTSIAAKPWTKEEVENMRLQYSSIGMDIDEMLDAMAAAGDQVPPDQREVMEFMRNLLDDPVGVSAEVKEQRPDVIDA
eukprot:TRINITY_DN48665_c0_g1_i1.p1 TRINITY_DN48665_c0_g1~~TRINITY_DN48665_c0_g1_i1.p1  ORF type:complete len:1337 (+),score=327.26 TRINITY_DN48665_c0_g1_i1:62-4072(+)